MMEVLSQLLGLLLCLGPLLAAGAWLVWLSRRPSRTCEQCKSQVYVKSDHCPACGAPLGEAPSKSDEQAA
ncbi:MAG: hypothetical protein KY475_12000 [Planctomycetes bacterium]|nr:hypothetical protein [Planctomycetota bacterium]